MSRVVIVGAGPAGASTAYLLARNGIEVELIERAGDFSRVFRGEGLMPTGLAALHAMGFKQDLESLSWKPLDSWRLHINRQFVMSVAEPSIALGDLSLRAVPQPDLLELIVDRAHDCPSFHFRPNTTARDLVFNNDRVAGVRAHADGTDIVLDADLVIGSDGRASAVRKRARLDLIDYPQPYDIAWFKVPKPAELDGSYPMLLCAAGADAAAAYISWDERLQIAAAIPKGGWHDIDGNDWLDACVAALPEWLERHIRAHADEIERPIPLDVIVGRCPTWHAPGVLLLGDAAHPMSPIRAHGINLALRDAVVAANHLVPALAKDIDPTVALAAIQAEREPEIIRCQALQQQDARGQDLARRRPRLISMITAIARPLLKLMAPTGLPQKAWLHAQHDLRYGVANVELNV